MYILGISALYHDSAAALVKDGEILAAVQEERFSRKKHDNRLPFNAINYCLSVASLSMFELDAVVYYDQPLLTMDRYIKNLLALGKDSDFQIEKRFDGLVSSRMKIDSLLRDKYGFLGKQDKLYTVEHHISHGASAFYPSPFENAAILTVDGVGEWATTAIGKGSGNKIEILEEIDYPHSIGLMYSAFTAFCGFKVNSGDYKFMGLAPYGEPVYYDLIKENIVDIKADGSFRLNLEYFDFYKGQFMTNEKFAQLFGGAARTAESKITRREMNIAASAQKITEEILSALAKHAREITGEKNLVMAGGVALNCVANGKILDSKIFNDIWIQPAAGDAGGSLGCALYACYNLFNCKRKIDKSDSQKGSYLGPEFSEEDICKYLDDVGACYHKTEGGKLYSSIAEEIANGKVIGWHQGRMEFGPRALGNRSILGDPRSEKMQSILNLKIKYRESFRPFAPAVLREDVSEYFETEHDSPYMLLVSGVRKSRRKDFDKEKFLSEYEDDMLPVVNASRSDVPAITHIDYSARVQTVDGKYNAEFYNLLREFKRQTGCSVLINTSFNVRGEPIVCTPEDAYICFMRTEMDILVLGNVVLYKAEQKALDNDKDWRKEYELD